ncbi:hypothetical protein V5H98_11260 [Georgenia sp. M64]|uniref:hypothetical protein n=1 Tax=Georgenia sp. M64 TaxID=3120520 RepID=UPI0030E0202F
MTRFTFKNAVKVGAVVFLFPFIAFLLLIIGLSSKRRRVLLEGIAYAVAFVIAISLPTGSAVSAFLGLGAMVASGIRSYQVRDLWLRRKSASPQPQYVAGPKAPQAPPLPYPGPQAAALPPRPTNDDFAPALAWVAAQAKQNKYRIPSESYVTILETCQTLDSVLDAEKRQPTADARFQYELGAMVKEYLPAVLRNYLAIPPDMVGIRQPNGRTADEELESQIQLLARQAETLHANRHRQSSADLTSTGNFLRERFGHHQQGGFDFGIE